MKQKINKEINNWLISINASNNTKEKYIKSVNDYCKHLDISVSEILESYTADIENGKLMPKRQIFYDLPDYMNELKERGLSPSSIKVYVSGVKSFLKHYYIEIPNGIKTASKPLEGNSNRFLERTQIKEIVDSSYNIRNKALILFMSTSGIAREEIVNLKCNQITFDDNNIGTIRLRRKKVDHDYYTFISNEATISLREYWAHREKTFDKSDFVFTNMKDNAQMTIHGLKKIFTRLNIRMGYDKGENKKYSDIRSHAMRKFFATAMENDGMSKDNVDWLLGHIPDQTTAAYFSKNNIEKMKSEYVKHLPAISYNDEIIIVTESAQIDSLKTEIRNLKDTIENIQVNKNKEPELNNNAENLIIENQQVKESNKELMNRMLEMMTRIEKLESK